MGAISGPCRGPIGLVALTPDRPHNLGALIRLAACLDVSLDVVEPAAFPLDDRRIREAALDYWQHLRWRRHADLPSFLAVVAAERRRVVLLTTAGGLALPQARFRPGDLLVVGSERDGAPPAVHEAAALRVKIPMRPGLRSLNVGAAAAIVLGAALLQLDAFPDATESRV